MIRNDAALPSPLLGAMAAALAVLVGLLAVISLQVALTAVLVAVLLAAYLHSPRLGVFVLWALWLLVPGVRRVLGLIAPLPQNDPLSVLPFLATGVIGVLEAQRCRLDGRGRQLVALAALGLALGVPVGLTQPQSLLFAGLAYFSAVSAFFIGWAEVQRGGTFSLRGALAFGLPLIAVYGVSQYFSLPLWDERWIASVDFESIGAPEEGRIRVFGTLNSPGTFAALLSLAVLCVLGFRRLTPGLALAVIPLTVALALTYARGAWACLVVGLVVLGFAGRGRSFPRVAWLMVLLVLLVAAAPLAGGTGRAFQERLTTFGELEGDTSANERIVRAEAILPAAREAPAGLGLGQAGLASNLGGPVERDAAQRTYPDNGVLALVYQCGPLGALLVLAAFGWGLVLAIRGSVRPGAGVEDRLLAAMVAFLVASVLFTDTLFGVTGAVLWYLFGIVAARARAGPAALVARAQPASAARLRSSRARRGASAVRPGATVARRP